MQSISPVTPAQLKDRLNLPVLKFEVYYNTAWVDITNISGENYLKNVSFSCGGIPLLPEVKAGKFSAVIDNHDGFFDPDVGSSPQNQYFRLGRKVRISLGLKLGETVYTWERFRGFMSEPRYSVDKREITIEGFDFMENLSRVEHRKTGNYYGSSQTFSTSATEETYGPEIYDEKDAMDIDDDLNNVDNWQTQSPCFFTSESNTGGGSQYVGKLQTDDSNGIVAAWVRNTNVGQGTAGKTYKFKFNYSYSAPSGKIRVYIRRDTTTIKTWDLDITTWTSFEEEFTCPTTGALRIDFMQLDDDVSCVFRVDQISIKEITGTTNARYTMPAACNGIWFATLNGEIVPYGVKDEGWRYDEAQNEFYFDGNKIVEAGTNNLVVYYFIDYIPEDAIADLMVGAGLYPDRATAKSDMIYTATGEIIKRSWEDSGVKLAATIGRIVERTNYRFYFRYDAKPVFKAAPTPKSPGNEDFTFDEWDVELVERNQDKEDLRNRVIIEGQHGPHTEERHEAMPIELKGEDYDQTSIDNHGEHTLTIRNHFFQNQSTIDSYCTTYKNLLKDPRWYFEFDLGQCPVPLEVGDTIKFKYRYGTETATEKRALVREIHVNNFKQRLGVEIVT